jgi:arylsulfatase A-like enzyme
MGKERNLKLLIVVPIVVLCASPVHAVSRPNIILVMADDLGYETLGCNGGTSYRTPHLDELAKTGARFTQCYANPLCTPTRVTLMTGRYNYRNYTAFAQLPPDEPTFGHMMQDAGYATAVVGKWQLKNRTPQDAGFDEFLLKVDSNRDGYADPVIYSSQNPEPKKLTGAYGPDVFWEYISGFLDRHRDRPFFLYYPMHLTHFYFSPTPESLEWESGDRRRTAEHHLRPDPLNTRFFTDMVAYMDKNMGRIVQKLQALGLREKTMILFLGDNGTEVSIRSRMGDREIAGEKGELTRAGTHVPMIVNWPGQVEPGLVSQVPVVPADFFATLAEAAGARARRPTGDGVLDGISFMPTLMGQPGKTREWALVEYILENRGNMYLGQEGRYVLDGRWKLYGSGISRRGQGYYRAGQLFDLKNDPEETSPIAPELGSPESTRARRRAQACLDRHPVPKRLTNAGISDNVAGTKPNIVFILTDDQGYGDLGCYGSTAIKTPHIDSLCEQGMKFTSFYVHNRCSPTRLAFMTGCHAHRAGCSKVIYRRDRMGINPAEITVAELLKQAGYVTGMVGKWHLGEWEAFNPVHHGFDSFYGFMEIDGDGGSKRGTGIFRNRECVEERVSKTDGSHSPKLLAAGIDFIKKNKDRPFFLYYASPLPHTNWKPLDRFQGSSKQGTYGDVVQEIDWQVGELLQALDTLELTRRTLVIFASDNGPQLNVDGCGSAGVLRDGKWTDFEGGIRVPCLMRWPEVVPAGSVHHGITGIIDMLPTFCDLAGVDAPSDRVIDGRSLLPALQGGKVDPVIHDTFIVPGAAIRYRDWKLLVRDQKPGGSDRGRGRTDRVPARAGSLFNLRKDPGEAIDVSRHHAEIVSQLQRKMEAAMLELKANTREIGKIDE